MSLLIKTLASVLGYAAFKKYLVFVLFQISTVSQFCSLVWTSAILAALELPAGSLG